MPKLNFALYGSNGHQIHARFPGHPKARGVAFAKFADAEVARAISDAGAKDCGCLDEILHDPGVQAVSLCSPLRSEQAADAIKCMSAGKHVYAEKPCAMTVAELDSIIQTSKRTGMVFHEMGGTAYSAPYAGIREIVSSGRIGQVIQVLSQKCYPWGDWRPGDESVDGGLALQVGVYNFRFVEHVAGVKVKSVRSLESILGNDHPGSQCRRAVSFVMELENGGLCSAVSNYCCPKSPSWNKWGNECLTIFGSKGFVESRNGGEKVLLSVDGEPLCEPDVSQQKDYLDMVVHEMLTGEKIISETLDQELSPTRWAIKARDAR